VKKVVKQNWSIYQYWSRCFYSPQ